MLVGIVLLVATFIQSMLVFTSMLKMEPLMGEGFFLMAVVFAIVLAQRAAQTHSRLEVIHQDLVQVSEKNLELNRTLEDKVRERTAELNQKNEEITDSIEYAGLIQNSILPDPHAMAEVFADHFVVWKPRDIVGGDCYWMARQGADFTFALLDCTGHGVPGALLTMTASAALDSIVDHINSEDPATILGELNRLMKRVLHQGHQREMTDDGLEIGLCHYSAAANTLSFAGSRISLFVLHDGELAEHAGDRQVIGYRRAVDGHPFTTHSLKVAGGMGFYLTTDGFLDQNGGTRGFAFGKARFRDILLAQAGKGMDGQKAALETALAEYQGSEIQRDDITVVGFKVAKA
jgi:serine phosphatase RsbU (regulator of sigma subunit)